MINSYDKLISCNFYLIIISENIPNCKSLLSQEITVNIK